MSALSEQLIALAQRIDEVQAQLGDVPAALEAEREAGRRERDGEVSALNEQIAAKQSEFDAMVAQKDQEKTDFGASEYQRGADEKICPDVPPSSDKIYSQADLDAIVVPLNDRLTQMDVQLSEAAGREGALQSRVDELQAIVDGLDVRISEAVQNALKEAKAKLDEAEGSIFPA